MHSIFRAISCLAVTLLICPVASAADLNVLFLGDRGHHQPKPRFDELQPVLADRGIQMTYTEKLSDLNAENLKSYDAVVLYANIDRIDPAAEQALLDYVDAGGGFVPLHCATFCFRNSQPLVELMGAQFQRHGTGVFRTQIAKTDHPVMRGFDGFESWDETYVHHLHNEQNRTVLSYRVDAEGREPWTWVRTQGKGRVFYTAWGHDSRTWTNPGFQNLVERGIRWAAGDDEGSVPDFSDQSAAFPVPKMTPLPTDVEPFKFIESAGKIPNYQPGVQGEAFTRMQAPLAPEESQKHFVVPEGFRVELFAAEPDIGGKPICMTWDHRGRLWIAETYDYPNELQPPGKGRDRIRILEDTDNDGRADKFTVFAEQLSIPTSIIFHRDDVIVHDGTRTLVLTDTDGDDVADQRRELFTGWSQGDTHGGVSNFQYGLDNWIWAMQGYNNSTPKNPAASQDVDATPNSFRNGFFRFRPDGSEIEFIRSTDNNTWGLGISEAGVIFGSTANRNPSVYMPIANRYYERVRGWTASLQLGSIADTHLFQPITKNVRQVDHHGGYTAAAGHALYTARQYPQAYWNRAAFVNGPTGHLVGTFVLTADGSDYHSTSPFNLLASDDEWTAPIMAEVGPDGNVWVIDWYNYIVQHNPTPRGFSTGKGNAYESVVRDKKHGRIYRVVYGDAPAPFTLAEVSPQKLVDALQHPNMLWRKHAQRLLVERGKTDVTPQLIQLVQNQQVDAIGLNVGAIHALWTLHGLGEMQPAGSPAAQAAVAALSHPSAGVRRNALQVLADSDASTRAVLASNVLQDDDPQVRLAGLLALSDLPAGDAAGPAILSALVAAQRDADRWLQDAAISAAATNADSFLTAVAQSSDVQDNTALLQAVAVIANHYGRGGPSDSIGRVVKELGKSDGQVAGALINGIAAAWPADRRPEMTDSLEADLQQLMQKLPASQQGVLVKLGRSWGSKQFEQYALQVSSSLLKQLDDTDLSADKRIAAAEEFLRFRANESEAVTEVLDRITPQLGPAVTVGIVNAIKVSEAKDAGQQLVEAFASLSPQARSAGINVLLSRPAATSDLVRSIESGDVLLSELSLDQKQALMNHPDRSLRREARRVLQAGGAVPNADRQKVLTKWLDTAKTSGDAAAGKLIFKKNCANCHMHSGEGQHVGPDLTGMAVHPKTELLTHILDPSRDVEGNYRVYTVLTADGLVVNGLLASESKTALEMFDAEGKKKSILRDDIEEIQASKKSLMPEGFENQIKPQEMTDLLEFLTARGQFLPLDLAKVATIASDRGMFINKDADAERLIFDDWSPKTFQKVPFQLIDPKQGTVANTILLNSPNGRVAAAMPKSVTLPVNGSARAIHMLSGVSGWGFPYNSDPSVSMIVRLHYADGQTEDHPLLNGKHFADYIRRVDVPDAEFAFALRGQQIRYLVVHPQRAETIKQMELLKGPDQSAPVVMAITLEQ